MSDLQLKYGKQYNSSVYKWFMYNNNPSATLVKANTTTEFVRVNDFAGADLYYCKTLQPTIDESTYEAYLMPFVDGVEGSTIGSSDLFDDGGFDYSYFSLDDETWYEYDSHDSSVVRGRLCSVERIDAPGSYIGDITSTDPNAYPQAGCLESDLTRFYAYSGIVDNLPPVGENQFVLCTDTGNFYIDIDGTRYQPNHMNSSGGSEESQYTYNLYSVVTTYQKDTTYWPEFLGSEKKLVNMYTDKFTAATDYGVNSSTGETTLGTTSSMRYAAIQKNVSYYTSGTSKNVTKYIFTNITYSGSSGTVTYERYTGGVKESKSKGSLSQSNYTTTEIYDDGTIQTINGTEYYVEVVRS